MDAFNLVFLAVGAFIGWFVRPYLGEKAKNLATKEDVADITRLIESARQEFTSETERLRAELQVASHERQTRFARLHERRAEAIDGLYKRLVRTAAAFGELTGGIVTSEEDSAESRLSKAGSLANDLVDFFGEYRLYFDQALISEFGRFERALREAWVHFAFPDRSDWEQTPRAERERIVAERRKAIEIVRTHVPELRLRIEERMRSALGDEEDKERVQETAPAPDKP